jgi:hypothetical protein
MINSLDGKICNCLNSYCGYKTSNKSMYIIDYSHASALLTSRSNGYLSS